MWKGVSVVTKPNARPIELAALKTRLRVDGTDDDAMITAMIDGAVAWIDGPAGVGIAMMTQTWRKAMDVFPACIVLPGWPIKSIAAVKYIATDGTEQTLDTADYVADLKIEPVRVAPAFGKAWPATRDVQGAVRVEYVLGEANATDVPADLVDAVCLLAGHRYLNREAVAEGTVSEIPLGFEHIVSQHRRSFAAA